MEYQHSDPALKAAFAIQDLLRSIVRGDGGWEFMNKSTRELADAIRALMTEED